MSEALLAAAAGGSFIEQVKEFINWLCQPSIFLTLSTLIFVLMLVLYKLWTRPVIFWTIFILFCVGYFASMGDEDFRSIVAKPDNVPITIMVLSVMLCIWLGFRRAALNDTRLAAGLLATAGLFLWAIVAKAPLEQPANPGYAPNPAKAPWYFLGLQEMLVYFDPWMAGVVYPGLIIVGLMAMPYIDTNPRGNGYYTLRERPFAIATWMFGFLILWVVLIFFGTFLRGPNWSFFGPYEYWDAHKAEALNNIDVSHVFWVKMMDRARPDAGSNPLPFLPHWAVREWLGIVLVGIYFVVLPAVLRATVFRRMYENMGAIRYSIMVMLLLFMALMPLKMVLRWVFNLKYLIYLPEFNANL
jgi:hypothetical protein